MSNQIVLSLGSNIGSKFEFINKAIKELNSKLRNIECSSLYLTEAYGYTNQRDFINLCLKAETDLNPTDLLEECKKIESKLGRLPRAKWHEREIDIDIIFFNELSFTSKDLKIPHTDYKNRRFVLIPLIELLGNIVPNDSDENLEEILAKCQDISKVEKIET